MGHLCFAKTTIQAQYQNMHIKIRQNTQYSWIKYWRIYIFFKSQYCHEHQWVLHRKCQGVEKIKTNHKISGKMAPGRGNMYELGEKKIKTLTSV
jgi:hypothetical protein